MGKTLLQLGSLNAGMCVAADDFAEARFEEPFQYERVQGRLVVMSPSGPEHRKVSRPFRRALGGYWQRNPDTVDDLDVEGWIATSPSNDRIADICVYLARQQQARPVPHRVPDLIFEFVSGSRADQERDYIDKRLEYHKIGVREYVIVDRFKKSALVLNWQKDDYVETILHDTDVYQSELLPGLKISQSEAFVD